MSEIARNAVELSKGYAVLALAVAGLCLAACTQEAPPTTDPVVEAATSVQDAAATAPPALPTPIPPATEVSVRRVEGLMVSRSSDPPGSIVVYASGLVGSRGWSSPRLVPAQADEIDGTYSLSFVATSPERETPPGDPQPMEALLEVSELGPGIDTVRIVAAENELTAPVSNSP